LKAVLEGPSSAVGEIARRARTSEAVASEYLRALQARGLIRAERVSRWVRYAPDPDPLVKGSRRLLAALRRALLAEGRSEAELIRALTAFTHPRRLDIMGCLLREGPTSFERLSARTRISQPALSRHLRKLEARGVVACEDHRWRLSRRPEHLVKTLLSLLGDSEEPLSHLAMCGSSCAPAKKRARTAAEEGA
jgi:DNA-binding transcriptional ArsR family regulator